MTCVKYILLFTRSLIPYFSFAYVTPCMSFGVISYSPTWSRNSYVLREEGKENKKNTSSHEIRKRKR